MAKITCTYCNTLNDAAEKTCIGCGAPLEIPTLQQAYQPQPAAQPFQPNPPAQNTQTTSPSDSSEAQKLQDGAQQVGQLYDGATSSLRTLGNVASDALAIALTAFALGVVGGATGVWYWGLAGATLAGLLIGFAEQSFWMKIAASPAGAMTGIVLGAFAWAAGAGPKWMVFAATGLACIGALIGSHRRTTTAGCGGAIRSVLGAAGGFFVALIGLLIGLAVRGILT